MPLMNKCSTSKTLSLTFSFLRYKCVINNTQSFTNKLENSHDRCIVPFTGGILRSLRIELRKTQTMSEVQGRGSSYPHPPPQYITLNEIKRCSHNQLRACLHGGGGPQLGEVTRLGGVQYLPAYKNLYLRTC